MIVNELTRAIKGLNIGDRKPFHEAIYMQHLVTVLPIIIVLGFIVLSEAQTLSPNTSNDSSQRRDEGTAKSDALTIATWNVQFLPLVGSGCCDHIPNRLTKIAERILATNIDVIALNEVFTDTAKNKLSRLLAPTYPYRVT